MDALHALAAAGARPGTAVVAAEQTAGRGARRNDWSSAPGGLWLTVMLRPAVTAGVELLSLRVGLSVAESLRGFDPRLDLMLKWPNDLMLADAKVGGILCEARWHGPELAWVAAGVGLNVSNPLPEETRLPAGRLGDVARRLDAEDLVALVVGAVRRVESGESLSETELQRFAALDWLRDREIAEPACGRVIGVAPDGTLRLADAEGRETRLRSGPVELAAGADARCC